MNQRLAIIDLDDTLLAHDKTISPENRRALLRLRAAGFQTVLASGRHHLNMMHFHEATGAADWIISSQGAVVRHAVTKALLHEFTIPEQDALAVCAAGRRAGLSVIVYHRDGIFIEAESEWTRLYAQRSGWSPQHANLAALAVTGIQKVLLTHSAHTMETIRPEFERAFGDRLYVVATENEILEFLSLHANKAVGAEALARKLGIDRSDTVAFGDGNNDVELLRWAGFSVAMAHGRPGAHRAASKVTPPGPPETAFARGVELVLERERSVNSDTGLNCSSA
jgi:Cof subfamily protein (haloacid dehalogenase superfamily)